MKVVLQEKGETVEIVAEGEIDLYSAPLLRRAILDAVKSSSKEIQVILASVEYMDSSGMATLVEGLKMAGQSEKTFVLKSPSPPVLKVLQLTKLDSVFTILAEKP